MIIKFPIEDTVLIHKLNKNYGMKIDKLELIPRGDSAYSYRIDCIDGQKYFLKLFDHYNERQRSGVTKLSYYLPLTWQLYHEDIFTNLTYPIKNISGDFKTSFDAFTTVIFNFIEGETLADAHPFSDELLIEVAMGMANIHKLTSKIDQTSLPKETFDISFASSLKNYVMQLERPSAMDKRNLIILKLREHILAYKELIKTSLKYVTELQNIVCRRPNAYVLCHGDIWGGNMIRHGSDLFFIDWESVVMAPPEYDFYGYIDHGFDVFITAYEKQLNRPVKLNLDLIRFYSYRAHLINLTNWIANILYGNHPEAQVCNDLDMICNHCLNRIEPIETHILSVKRFHSQRSP